MKRFDIILLKIFLWEIPIVILYGISLVAFDLEMIAQSNMYAKMWYLFGGGIVFGSWMSVSFLLSIRLMVSTAFREKVLSKITFLKERDERESMLTGRAARNTLLTTLATLLLLFCLSCFQFSLYRVPQEQAVDGKDKVLILNFNFALTEDQQQKNFEQDQDAEKIIAYKGLPLSGSSIILGLICWQIVSYNYLMYRAIKCED